MTDTQHLSLKFDQLEKAKQIAQNSVPKIQRVAHHLRDRKHFAKHYLPRLVSIGPIHHGAEKLQLGEKYKLMWAAMYLERTKKDAQTLYQKIASNIEQLKELFAEDVVRDFPDDEKLSWSWMLFVDGCSLLQILEKGKLHDPKEMNVKVDQLVLVWQDVLLLENQLPYQVLKLLSDHGNDATLVKSMNEFLKCHHLSPVRQEQKANKQDMGNFETKDEDRALTEEGGYTSVYVKNEDTLKGEHRIEISQESPIHLLDQLRRYVLHDPHKKKDTGRDKRKQNTNEDLDMMTYRNQKRENNTNEDLDMMTYRNQKRENNTNEDLDMTTYRKQKSENNTNEDLDMTTYRNIQELRAAGIKLKRDKSRRLREVSFSYRWMCLCAELTLPEITVDDTTAPTFLNLIAYEMCPDFRNNFEICSFVAFMDSLIDHPDDVKELRTAKVLHNALGSDEEVAKLFNTISTDLVPDTESYSHVRRQIEKHYRSKYRTWIALGYHTYFSNPWAIIAFHAALVALVLTFIQTWFAIYPVG